MSHVQSFIVIKSLLRRRNSISKRASLKKLKTPILPNFNREPFLTSKSILEGSYAFVLFLKWIYILTNERNLQNEHFVRNYSGVKNWLILEYFFRVSFWKPWNYSQNNKWRLFWIFFSKIPKIDYFKTK